MPAGHQPNPISERDRTGAVPYCWRSPGQLARFFDGLDLVEPGLVSCTRWRPPGQRPRRCRTRRTGPVLRGGTKALSPVDHYAAS
jgi:hypothetical protein